MIQYIGCTKLEHFYLLFWQALNPGRAAEELKLISPRIEAVTDSNQYETLVDVINSVATPPPPKISLLRDPVLGATGSALEDTNEDILQAKEMLRAVYVEFNARREEVGSPVVDGLHPFTIAYLQQLCIRMVRNIIFGSHIHTCTVVWMWSSWTRAACHWFYVLGVWCHLSLIFLGGNIPVLL